MNRKKGYNARKKFLRRPRAASSVTALSRTKPAKVRLQFTEVEPKKLVLEMEMKNRDEGTQCDETRLEKPRLQTAHG